MSTINPFIYGIHEAFLILFGTLIAISSNFVLNYLNNRKKERHSASILLHDLKSIEWHARHDGENITNFRYTPDWQALVAECHFLTEPHIIMLYKIYDEVHCCNVRFSLAIQREANNLHFDYGTLEKLRGFIASDEWLSVKKCLERKGKGKEHHGGKNG